MLICTAFRTALFSFLHTSDFHFPNVRLRLSRASLTVTLSVCHASLLQDLRDRNFRHNSSALPFARRSLALSGVQSFSRSLASPKSYSSPGSFAVTLVAIVHAVVSFRLRLVIYSLSSRPLHLPFTLLLFVGKCSVRPQFFTPRAAWSVPHFSSSVWRRFP